MTEPEAKKIKLEESVVPERILALTSDEKLQNGLTKLSERQLDALEWHLAKSCEIQKWFNVILHLADEFHNKKSLLSRRNIISYPDELTDSVQHTIIYMKDKYIGSFSPWYVAFKGSFDSLLVKEVRYPSEVHQLMRLEVYYGTNSPTRPFNRYFENKREINKNEWPIDEGMTMSPRDIETINKFMRGFVDFLSDGVDELKPHGLEKHSCEDVLKRVVRTFKSFTTKHPEFKYQ